MKFVIDTTWSSGYNPPCEGAEIYEYDVIVRKPIRDENGRRIWMETQMKTQCWTIEINSLEDLMKLKDSIAVKCDDSMFEGLIILQSNHCTGLPQIEIYDTYRE